MEKLIRINHNNFTGHFAILLISQAWTKMADAYGDKGSCVIGAKFKFDYANFHYIMCPRSKWQGSLSWEHCIDVIELMLQDAGATNIRYDYGMID
jgi:hypothetical protein